MATFLAEIKEVKAKKQGGDNIFIIKLETNDLEVLALGALDAQQVVKVEIGPENG